MQDVLGLILAGGLARRMGGGDKCLRPLAGRPILAHVLDRLAPQLGPIALSANGDPNRFAAFALPVLPDPILPDPVLPDRVLLTVPDRPGPLAGILAGLDWAAAAQAAWLVTAPADAPFLPPDLVARLRAGRGAAPMAIAASAGRAHPVIGLWPTAMRPALRAALASGQRKVGALTAAAAVVEWPAIPLDPFFNVNAPDDLAQAERHA